MRPYAAEVYLRWILIVNGVVMLFAIPAIFMSTASMNGVHEAIGLGPLPEGAIVQYLARSVSAIYAGLGLLTLLLAWDPTRFAPLVAWWGWCSMVFGILLCWIDSTAGMPAFWTWGEGPYLIATGAATIWLQKKSRV